MEGQGSGAVQAKIASIGDRAADLEAELGSGLGPKLQTWPTAVAAFSQLSRQLAQLQNSSDKMFERVAVAPHAVLPDLQAIPLLLTTRLDKEHEDARDALSDAAARAVADGEVAGGAAMDGEVTQRNEALTSALTHYDQATQAMADASARAAAAAAAPAAAPAPAPASAGAADHIPGLPAMLPPWARRRRWRRPRGKGGAGGGEGEGAAAAAAPAARFTPAGSVEAAGAGCCGAGGAGGGAGAGGAGSASSRPRPRRLLRLLRPGAGTRARPLLRPLRRPASPAPAPAPALRPRAGARAGGAGGRGAGAGGPRAAAGET